MAKDSIVYKNLAGKWQEKHKALQGALWEKHGNAIRDFISDTRNFAIGSLSSLVLLTSPAANLLPPSTQPVVQEEKLPVDKSVFLIADLSNFIPQDIEPLNAPRENEIAKILTRYYGFKVTRELSGIRLNRNYGYIGAEQHLMRYPGDSISSHFESDQDSKDFYSSGMAPGLGGWGYFAPSRKELTQKAIDEEKYYIAVQTFLAPGFAEHTGEYITFFKFRKMLVVNPENGRAVVADIGDAGPGSHTGKQFGGSPEVMKYLNRVDGAQKGPVLIYFIDDPGDKIPLGPVEPV